MTEETKNPVGRPSKYDPSYCERVIQLGADGNSKEAIAVELGITWKTLNNWADEFPDFLLALEEAKNLEMVWFEKIAKSHMIESPGGNRLNTALWGRSVAARFPVKYRENNKVEVTGRNDGPIQVDHVHDFATQLMEDLLGMRQDDAESGNRK